MIRTKDEAAEAAIRGCAPHDRWLSNSLEKPKMIDWFPIVAGTFKVLVLGTGMFFAIKWHYDKGKMEKEKEKKEDKESSGP